MYLLDDPLSAVDVHVGRHLFQQCIQRLCGEGKAVLLTTNQVRNKLPQLHRRFSLSSSTSVKGLHCC